jgi:predicted transposase/invertase (TIGR01784 family)
MVKGGKYEHLKEVIFIAIIDYELFPHKEHYHSTHQLCDQTTHECDLPELRFEFLELPRFKKQLNEITTIVEKWCYYFKYAPETTLDELERLVGSDEVIKEAYKALDAASWTRDELFLYERETKNENDALSILRRAKLDGMEKGIKKGMEKGMEKGLAQGRAETYAKQRETACKLRDAGVSLSIIAQSTGLSIDDIQHLK